MYVFVDLSLGMVVGGNRGEWVPKLNKSLYGLKQEIANWFGLLKTGLESKFYHQFQVEPCVFYIKYSVILTCVDDCVIVSYKQYTIISLIQSINNGPKNYVLTNEGDISNYLGVHIKKS